MSDNKYNQMDSNTIEASFNEYIYSAFIPKQIENHVLKFHQSSTFIRGRDMKHRPLDEEVEEWLLVSQNKDISPEYYQEKIMLNDYLSNNLGSCRTFNTEKTFNIEEISSILNNAFARGKDTPSKKYGSAGGLYPTLPILLVFDTNNHNLSRGTYVYDSTERALLKITSWSEKESLFIKSNVCFGSASNPNLCMAYAVDLRKTLIKYHIRGYRHALIEVGAMSQAFKESIIKFNENIGEICWSGFNDNELSKKCGLNLRLCPIVLLQWFGFRENK